MKAIFLTAVVSALALGACGSGGGGGGSDAARQQIRIVGSSTVYPFSVAVSEQFARNSNGQFKAPIVESTGTGAGIQLFCRGVGGGHPDIVNASRRLKPSELEMCKKNGVNQVIEIPIGIDGLALVESRKAKGFSLTRAEIYQAVAANPFGEKNKASSWNQVKPGLPSTPIFIYGPPPTSGTRDSFVELFLVKGCETNAAMKSLAASDPDKHKDLCQKVREDGFFIEAGENDNLMIQKVADNQGAVGILGYSFLDENADKVRAIPVEGVMPSSQTIASGQYPGARPLFIYVKGEHLAAVPGIKQFVAEYSNAWGVGGYLERKGLIPTPADQQAAAKQAALALKPLDPATLN